MLSLKRNPQSASQTHKITNTLQRLKNKGKKASRERENAFSINNPKTTDAANQ